MQRLPPAWPAESARVTIASTKSSHPGKADADSFRKVRRQILQLRNRLRRACGGSVVKIERLTSPGGGHARGIEIAKGVAQRRQERFCGGDFNDAVCTA